MAGHQVVTDYFTTFTPHLIRTIAAAQHKTMVKLKFFRDGKFIGERDYPSISEAKRTGVSWLDQAKQKRRNVAIISGL